jgi:hypothetical protein
MTAYPLAKGEVAGQDTTFVKTGEKRPPKSGEYYLGRITKTVRRATHDFSDDKEIMTPVGVSPVVLMQSWIPIVRRDRDGYVVYTPVQLSLYHKDGSITSPPLFEGPNACEQWIKENGYENVPKGQCWMKCTAR